MYRMKWEYGILYNAFALYHTLFGPPAWDMHVRVPRGRSSFRMPKGVLIEGGL